MSSLITETAETAVTAETAGPAAPGDASAWTSWHLHLATAAPTAGDRVVREVVVPVVTELNRERGHRWFFMRYWQGGPHVRLRIEGLDATQSAATACLLAARLRAVVPVALGEEPLDAEAFRDEATRHARTETGTDRVAAALRPPGVHDAVYEPELERYGGAHLMSANEDLFELSSRMVAAVLRGEPSRGQRAAAALRASVAAATALGAEADQAAFYAIGRRAWEQWARDFGYPGELVDGACAVPPEVRVEALEHGPFAPWHDAVAGLVERIRTRAPAVHPGGVVSSQVHMTHNRLGLGILDELRTYAVLATAFPTSRATG